MDFDLTTGIAVLERTPHTLRAMLDGRRPMWTDATEGPFREVQGVIHELYRGGSSRQASIPACKIPGEGEH